MRTNILINLYRVVVSTIYERTNCLKKVLNQKNTCKWLEEVLLFSKRQAFHKKKFGVVLVLLWIKTGRYENVFQENQHVIYI